MKIMSDPHHHASCSATDSIATITDSQKTYILTFDLERKLRLLRSVGIKTPNNNDSVMRDVRQHLTDAIKNCFSGQEVVIHSITMEDLADEIWSKALNKKSLLQNAVVVSTCLELAAPRYGHTLEINRIINIDGNIIGIGPRPGFPPIDDQLANIAHVAAGQPIVIVEDGSFTGNTLCHTLNAFRAKGLDVAAIVVGFIFQEARQKVKNIFNGELIVVEEMADYLDWLPDHDFFPFTPNCGRVLGTKFGNDFLPFYTYNGASYAVPYLTTFCDVTAWAGIPHDRANAFSLWCAQTTLAIYRAIDALNGEQVKIGDLLQVRPRISVPISVGQKKFPSLDTKVSDFLVETCHMMA